MLNETISGSCLCGAIAFEVSHLERVTANCHCTMCRKFHGAAFATFGVARFQEFTWQRGQDLLGSFEASNGTTRRFCSKCGSSLIFEPNDNSDEFVLFALGALDTPIDKKPESHIFTGFKAFWFEITDGLPQFKESANVDGKT